MGQGGIGPAKRHVLRLTPEGTSANGPMSFP